MKRLAVALALASATLAGCGSTVQISGSATSGAADGLGGVVQPGPGTTPGTTSPLTPRTSDGVTGSPTTGGGVTGPGDGTATTGGAGSTARPGSVTGGPKTGRAGAPVKIGVITQPGLETTAKAFGLDGVTTGDTLAQVKAVVGWISANGGLGGRQIKLYEYKVNMGDGNNDVILNKACTAMAQDYKVDFVVTVLGNLNTLADCLSKRRIGLLADNTSMGDKSIRKYAAGLAQPSEMAPGRTNTLLIDELWSQKWLTAASKVGLLVLDTPDGHATVDDYVTPALKRLGLTAAKTIYVNPNSGDGGSSASSSAVLQFRSSMVDRVIPILYSPLYMMIAAESQEYRPAYAMISAQGPGALLEGLAPANQLKNAKGIGWAPYLDIGKGPKPPPVSARATLCFELMEKARQAATSALVKGFQAQVCDVLFYLKDLADLEPSLPEDLLTSARVKLAKRYVSPATYVVDVTSRTDGVGGYRPLAYLDSCGCFQYTGPVRRA